MVKNKKINRVMVMVWTAMFSTLLTACSEIDFSGEPQQRADNHDFYQHWVNSYEEQTGGGLVFRPAGSREFPESRFRMEYIFNTDGSCQYKSLNPADAHRMENCVFTKVGNKIYIYDDAGAVRPDLSFTFSVATKDVMRAIQGIQKPLATPDKKKEK